MKMSARNRLPGVVTDIKIDGLLAQVELNGRAHQRGGLPGTGSQGGRQRDRSGQSHLSHDRLRRWRSDPLAGYRKTRKPPFVEALETSGGAPSSVLRTSFESLRQRRKGFSAAR